jgi:hypothetical protein
MQRFESGDETRPIPKLDVKVVQQLLGLSKTILIILAKDDD